MAVTQTLGVLSGNVPAEPAPGYDPNAPVEKPRHCGLCKHFGRFALDPDLARSVRFGECRREGLGRVLDFTKEATSLGPSIVGDEFACKFFDSGL